MTFKYFCIVLSSQFTEFLTRLSKNFKKIIYNFVRYITHNSYAISVVPPFNRL